MKYGPDFLCIGAQKAGTTWVYDNLRHHPDVWLPPPPFKELHYFDNRVPNRQLLGEGRYDQGGLIRRYGPLLRHPSWEAFRWLWRFNHHWNDSAHWYQSLFTVDGRLCGDITPEYSTLDERGVEFAREVVGPHCKILLIMRDPVSRSWSALKMRYRWLGRDIRKATHRELLEEMKMPYSVLRTDYSRMIKTWKQFFSDENFKVFFFDDLKAEPERFLSDICTYLGIQTSWQAPMLADKSNVDGENISMPEELRRDVTAFFLPELRQLEPMVGSHAEKWLEKGEKLFAAEK